ncbi:MAG: hypothetical protein A2W25_13660 [candidate division Zixibacteria bacterium RBG_16_53_22]|nr:MAG: hypothetical protein A2W25_13660 [candidate division Zixibacteria bacterium RBG_16_53_22]
MWKIWFIALVWAVPCLVFARIINVPGQYTTIQAGIDASIDGDTVLVQRGTYTGDGNRDIDFGGRHILVISEHGRDSTIIDCGGNPGQHRAFYFHNNEDSTSILDGFTIRRGYELLYGGGISCVGASPRIINCSFTGNVAKFGGGVSLRSNSNAILANCTFWKDTASAANGPAHGGGIYCDSSSAQISRCVFSYNLARSDGGGIFCQRCSPSIQDCVFDYNLAQEWGGGISCASSSPSITGCRFTGGRGVGDGGGIYCSHSSPSINDCIFDTNYADGEGGALSCVYGSSPTISNSSIWRNWSYGGMGGGIYCENSSIALDDCRLTRNGSQNRGGAIYFMNGSGTLDNCLIDSNAAVQGGGISFILTDSVVLTGCVFDHDSADPDGGAVYLQYSSPLFSGCSFVNNVGNIGAGAGAEVELYSSPVFRNCLFAWNTGLFGGAMAVIYGASAILINCTIYGNSATGDASGIGLFEDGDVTVINTIMAFNLNASPIACWDENSQATLSYCDIFGNADGDWIGCIAGQYGIRGNISSDPFFRNASQNDFLLCSDSCGYPVNSPCIDAGDPTLLDSLLDCAWGLGTSRADMGAYGGGGDITAVDDQSEKIMTMTMLLPPYPNPFNAQTTIRFSLPEAGPVRLDIYDILGRKIGTPYSGALTAGEQGVVWNAAGLPSGVYLYRLDADGRSLSGKMTLLK